MYVFDNFCTNSLLYYLVWPLKNTAVTGPFTYTLKASGADTDTYKKFSINNTSSELRLNYTFDFEVKKSTYLNLSFL